MLLEVDHVSMHFGGLVAVSDCTFGVRQGTVTSLIGPNGAGKTTVFNLITGFLRPTTGRIRYEGRDVTGLSPQRLLRMGVARTFQNLRLHLQMTVLENVMLTAQRQPGEDMWSLFLRPRMTSRAEAEVRERALEHLDFVGLADRAGELADNLSYAEQKLLSIARILMTEARLLLLDEPASGLDPDSLRTVLPVVRRLVERGKTVLLIEHNMDLVKELADEIVFLHQGTVLAQGKPADVMSNAELTAIYFGGGVTA
ncbi:ABC transporter ATP-binding protein [Caldinitratiruptor microaerophilus]|uniref:ABC transporter ATP-binding protein n=1 Tax=Caldinitratiruptor microaerophilus TaxID=671077 RepID=A0AA35CIP5_9FIRM|nr:ABC transporter ATP-binding protein [Caldinitratiruptor microaerophilus]BDG59837.1 ABC transporter ATP-binding protein [Caldinitratiruptor microaerophilus]